MSSKPDASKVEHKTKKFGKSERTVPHHTQKAKKFYPAEDEAKPRKVRDNYTPISVDLCWKTAGMLPSEQSMLLDMYQHLSPRYSNAQSKTRNSNGTILTTSHQVRKSIHDARPRKTLQPGTVLILLAGRFRGKRVILLKHLPQGVLLVTGPFKVNGVPLRRVNARYVIATSAKVELKGIDEKLVEKVGEEGYFTREKATDKTGEEKFFAQGEKPEVSFAVSAGAG